MSDISFDPLDRGHDIAQAINSIAVAIERHADEMKRLARAVELLGNADAATQFGGLEGLGVVLQEGFARLAGAVEEHK